MKKQAIHILTILFSISLVAQNVELDKFLGEQNAKIVVSEMGIYNDLDKTEYIRKIGNRLVAELENPLFEYQFHLVENPSPNAFALPGGYLYVTTGLLPILQSEDELACILGHEIIHSNNRHSIKQLKKSIFPKLLEVPGKLIGVIDSEVGELFNAPIEMSNELLLASYGRKSETEADKEGIELAAKAGYNPNAMITALSRLSKTISVATGEEESKSYFNDHPYTPDRLEAIQNQISGMTWKKTSQISSNYLQNFDGTLFGDNPEKGIIKDNTFIHPELNFHVEFPEKWTIDNQNSHITAYDESQQSGIYIVLDNPNLSPKKSASVFVESLKKEYKEKIIKHEHYQIGNRKGYLVTFQDKVETQTVFAYALWIPMEDKLFRIMGIASKQDQNILKEIVLSLRKLSIEEQSHITINRMSIVTAKKGETIQSLSKREHNLLNENLTCVINDKNTSDKLKKGEQIKIIKTFKY
ncbi:M48 family metalloprotease [Algibacter mikhailovii]|uniref:LysM domain-containing protein n=1 Tax=Algibacter mikhailovii TaxID=425498 RepID=A0A918V6V3_9FLAO|nr:M48 family metalloprotease [Algibacter mikhailovii]GGZ74849.1 hypothetical protein GCM10007028_10300 [Algibacter mikhailovii]